MWRIIVFLLVIGLIGRVISGIGAILYVVFLYIILPIIGIVTAFHIVRTIYHLFNPEAKKAYLEKKEQEEAKAKAKTEQEEAEAKVKRVREEAEKRRKKIEHQQHRDGDQQATPYTYQIGKHANESLAIRYGIANQEKKTKEYWYYLKGGERKRNFDRDITYYEPATTIRLKKTKKVGKDLYEVLLTDFRERNARAVIEVGAEYVKTFYPLEDGWFEKHADLEKTLKGNGSFTLKELATFHVQKTVGA